MFKNDPRLFGFIAEKGIFIESKLDLVTESVFVFTISLSELFEIESLLAS